MRVGWDIMAHDYCFDELAMVCITHRAVASAAATAHLAAYQNMRAQLIRPQSEGSGSGKKNGKTWKGIWNVLRETEHHLESLLILP